jgi:predicted RNA-binding Zn ribbon-like protein
MASMPNPGRGFRREDPPAPIVVGGHPALDFLNTLASPRGEPLEFLPNGTALFRWLVLTGGVDAGDVRTLRRRFSDTDLDAAARRAVTLREWFCPIVRRLVSSGTGALSPAELRHLNAILARGSRFPQVARQGRGYGARQLLRWNSADDLLAPIADAIADLLCTADFRRIRKCGSPRCTLWFLDRTKAHRRQWCAMEVCGNRAKVTAHRRRAKSARPVRQPRRR